MFTTSTIVLVERDRRDAKEDYVNFACIGNSKKYDRHKYKEIV